MPLLIWSEGGEAWKKKKKVIATPPSSSSFSVPLLLTLLACRKRGTAARGEGRRTRHTQQPVEGRGREGVPVERLEEQEE